MRNLRVEELEPRNLLSGTRWFFLPPLAEPPVLITVYTIRVVERVSFVDYGGYAAPTELWTCCEQGTVIEPAAKGPLHGYDGRDQEPPPSLPPLLAPPGPAVGSPENGRSVIAAFGVDHPDISPNATVRPGNPETSSAGIPVPPIEAVASSRPAFGAPPPVIPPILSETPMPEPTPSLDDDPVDAPVPIKEREVLPPLQRADVLTALPSFDLATLERGMQQFLDQIEGVGEQLGGSSGPGLYPWIAAMAAAAVACEVGRRQLKRPVEVAMPEASHLAGWPPDEGFAE
jgi:hypothetical protein